MTPKELDDFNSLPDDAFFQMEKESICEYYAKLKDILQKDLDDIQKEIDIVKQVLDIHKNKNNSLLT